MNMEEYEILSEVSEASQQVNPILMWSTVLVISLTVLILLFVYIPRIEEITRLNNKINKLNDMLDVALSGWCYEILESNGMKEAHKKAIKEKDGRIKQASDRAAKMAFLYENKKESA